MIILKLMQMDIEDYRTVCELGFFIRPVWKSNGDKDAVILDTDAGPRRLHRFILNLTDPTVLVDHINGDPFDNRRCNLRLCNNMQNQMNARPHLDKQSKLPKGVVRSKSNPNYPYMARISVMGARIQIGYYATPEQAARAYQIVAEGLHGKFEYVTSRSKK